MTTSSASSLPTQPRYLRRDQAAAYIREVYNIPCTKQWLAKLAVTGGGPAFRKAGPYPLYDVPDLDSWAEDRIGPRVLSTAELSAA
jgi:hypothetical protein